MARNYSRSPAPFNALYKVEQSLTRMKYGPSHTSSDVTLENSPFSSLVFQNIGFVSYETCQHLQRRHDLLKNTYIEPMFDPPVFLDVVQVDETTRERVSVGRCQYASSAKLQSVLL